MVLYRLTLESSDIISGFLTRYVHQVRRARIYRWGTAWGVHFEGSSTGSAYWRQSDRQAALLRQKCRKSYYGESLPRSQLDDS